MADKVDPFDVAALERAVNDSAGRVSTIWVSFLLFALYLVISAGTITHRQLFLEDPVKLPVLNIDLPLWGFFFLAPILFVIFHAYVLLQVLLLGRTAAAYNAAVDKAVKPPSGNASIRQRLANTLFAQIFAGSPRERQGPIGLLLRLMAWITLAIAPVLVLLVFQFKFLPYHSHVVTWSHRLLVLIELATVFLLWPMALDAARDLDWRRVLLQPFSLVSALLVIVLSLSVATFPGEPHVNLFTGRPLHAVDCSRWIPEVIDRLDVRNEQLVDTEKLARIERDAATKGLLPSEGERTRNFAKRDLACGTFTSADLRRANFNQVEASGAAFDSAWLQGADFSQARLRQTNFFEAHLQQADFGTAELQGSFLRFAELQGAFFFISKLQGANLQDSDSKGAYFATAMLQGASLDRAELQGATFWSAPDPAHFIGPARLEGASLDAAKLQGADLRGTSLRGASLDDAQLQGADLDGSDLALASISNAYVWRAKGARCADSRVINPRTDAVLDIDGSIRVTKEAVGALIARVLYVLGGNRKDETRLRMAAGLDDDPGKADTAEIEKAWQDCAARTAARKDADFAKEQAAFLRSLVCDAATDRRSLAAGVVRNWISDDPDSRAFSRTLALGLLGRDGKACAAAAEFDEDTKGRLQAAADAPPD